MSYKINCRTKPKRIPAKLNIKISNEHISEVEVIKHLSLTKQIDTIILRAKAAIILIYPYIAGSRRLIKKV